MRNHDLIITTEASGQMKMPSSVTELHNASMRDIWQGWDPCTYHISSFQTFVDGGTRVTT